MLFAAAPCCNAFSPFLPPPKRAGKGLLRERPWPDFRRDGLGLGRSVCTAGALRESGAAGVTTGSGLGGGRPRLSRASPEAGGWRLATDGPATRRADQEGMETDKRRASNCFHGELGGLLVRGRFHEDWVGGETEVEE